MCRKTNNTLTLASYVNLIQTAFFHNQPFAQISPLTFLSTLTLYLKVSRYFSFQTLKACIIQIKQIKAILNHFNSP